MNMDQKIRVYTQIAESMNNHQFNLIKEFYTDWIADDTLQLQHRYIKLFGFDTNLKKAGWYRLDKFANKRRIQNDNLGNEIIKMIEKGIYPIRIFQSVAEWLDPRSVIHQNDKVRMISSGILVLENDDTLADSIECAKLISSYLEGNKTFVYSGNQSIHVWYHDFYPESHLNISEREFILKREYYDRVARYNLYEYIQKQLQYKIDKRVTIDSRRVVPCINSLNALTGRIVTKVDLNTVNANDLKNSTKIPNWES